jgi:hypothetical protein
MYVLKSLMPGDTKVEPASSAVSIEPYLLPLKIFSVVEV